MDYNHFGKIVRGSSLGPVMTALIWLCANATLAQSPAQQTQVQMQALGQVESFQVGASAGIPFAMNARQWRGTNVDVAISLISDLPEVGASPLLNRLAASVLMSPSDPPTGTRHKSALSSLRIASVYRLGLLDTVIDLAERSPGGLSDPENAAIATRAFLALGRDSDACETAVRLQTGRDAVFWLKVRAFCFAREGRQAAAELTAGLALEADPDDADFLLVLGRMLDKDTATARPINALEFAMARFTGASIDLGDAPFALHSAMAKTQTPAGLIAARRKAIAGLMDAGALAQLYMNWPGLITDDIVSTDADEAVATEEAGDQQGNDDDLLAIVIASEEGVRDALIYQSAVLARTDVGRANAIYEGLRHEKELGGFLAASRLYAPLLVELSQSEEQQNTPRRLFFYALLAANHHAHAQSFINTDDPAMTRLSNLSSGTRLAAIADEDTVDAGRARLAYVDLMTLVALGTPLHASHRDFLFTYRPDSEDFASCTAGARAVIAGGAAQGVHAASFLRSALMLADSGFDKLAPECGATVIRAFKVMGYDDLARQAALEMMLGQRLR